MVYYKWMWFIISGCGLLSGDPIEFLLWLLHTLHNALGGNKRHGSSVVHKIFQGHMKITTRKLPPASEDMTKLMNREEYQGNCHHGYHTHNITMVTISEKVTDSPFLYLSLDLPPTPLFQVILLHYFTPLSLLLSHYDLLVLFYSTILLHSPSFT